MRYTPLSSSSLDDNAASTARLSETRASARNDRRSISRFLPALGLAAALFSTGFLLGSHDRPSASDPSLVLRVAPSSHSTLQSLRFGDQAAAELHQVSWQDGQGATSSLKYCTFRNICIRGRPRKEPVIEYILNASPKDRPADAEMFRTIFDECFRAIRPRERKFSTYRIDRPGMVEAGTTLAFMKKEVNNHPAAWARAWAPVAALLLKDDDVLHHKIEHVQLLEQSTDLNSWAAFIMNVALKIRPSNAIPTWDDDRAFVDTNQTTCFEHLLATREHERYFPDTEVASMFRQHAYRSMGVAEERRPSCRPEGLQVVYLQRDRPVWNQAELLEIVRRQTPSVQIRTITEHTPYHIQGEIFASADVVISVHGAQLTNQLFMRRGAGLVELFPHMYDHQDLAELGKAMQVDHVRMVNNPLPPRSQVSSEFKKVWEDVRKLSTLFNGSSALCMEEITCRGPVRQLGAYVDLREFEAAYGSLVQRVTQRC